MKSCHHHHQSPGWGGSCDTRRERKTAHGTEGGTNDSSGVRSFPPLPLDRRRLIRHLQLLSPWQPGSTPITPIITTASLLVSPEGQRAHTCTLTLSHTHTPIRTATSAAPDLRDYSGCLTGQRVLVSNQRVRTTCRPSSGNLVNQPFRDSDVRSDSVPIKAVGGGEQETLWELMSTPARLSRVSRAN